jgi:glucose-6-phosphate isomerase
LEGFLLGTRRALSDIGRPSITVTLRQLTVETLSALIALYERAVGFYASFVGINAYHQPGVEAGKKAASSLLALKKEILRIFAEDPSRSWTADEWLAHTGQNVLVDDVRKVMAYLEANGRLRQTDSDRYQV